MEIWLMDRCNLFTATALVAALSIPTIANSALVGRLADSNGNYQAYYDTEADLTWLADANYSMTSGYDSDGRMSQSTARTWASTLNISGITGWRLPTTLQPDYTCSDTDAAPSNGFNCTGSEMGNLFYNVLGGSSGISINDSHNSNYDFISNYGNYHYWSSTSVSDYGSTGRYFYFDFNTSSSSGYQAFAFDVNEFYAMAVIDGDITTVPISASVWLFGSGLIGLAGFARKNINRRLIADIEIQ